MADTMPWLNSNDQAPATLPGAVHRFTETTETANCSKSFSRAIPKGKRYALFPGKPFHTFPGIALTLCFDAIPDGKPLHTFPGIALTSRFFVACHSARVSL